MRHDDVKFHWFGPDEDTELRGQVLLREGNPGPEMVIDINDPDGASRYLIVGRTRQGSSYFSGSNSANGRTTDVFASWAAVEGGYVGRWIEERVEYLFRFSLPQAESH